MGFLLHSIETRAHLKAAKENCLEKVLFAPYELLHLQREALGMAVLGQERLLPLHQHSIPISCGGLQLTHHAGLHLPLSSSSPHRRFSNWDSTQTMDSGQQHEEFLQPTLILLGLRLPAAQRNCSRGSRHGLGAQQICCGCIVELRHRHHEAGFQPHSYL